MRKNRYKREKTSYKACLFGLGGLAILLLLSVIFIMGYLYVCQLPFFQIKEVQVVGNKLIPAQKVISLADCQGKSLLCIHKARIAHFLSQLPLVKTFSIKRAGKNTLRINIVEYRPLAWAYMREHWWIVEKSGQCILSNGFENLDLPIITGLSSPHDAQIKTAISLLKLWKQKTFGQEISEIHIDEDLGLSVFTLEGYQILLGHNQFSKKLEALQKVLAYLKREKSPLKFIDLTNTHRIYAKIE